MFFTSVSFTVFSSLLLPKAPFPILSIPVKSTDVKLQFVNAPSPMLLTLVNSSVSNFSHHPKALSPIISMFEKSKPVNASQCANVSKGITLAPILTVFKLKQLVKTPSPNSTALWVLNVINPVQ